MEQKVKHTPGPWALNESGILCDAKGDEVAILSPWIEGAWDREYKKGEEVRWNMALIAAAPAMLEALKDCVDALEDGTWSNVKAAARAAIAQAEGGNGEIVEK